MTCHFALSERFSNLLLRMWQAPRRRNTTSPRLSLVQTLLPADRELLANTLLHAADISNQCKSWTAAKRWSDCILFELFHQGDMERDAGLNISPNCDRHTTDRLQFTLNFIDFVVAPLFVSLTQLLPNCVVACSLLRENRQHWGALLLQSIEESNLPLDKKREEELRWRRRMDSFDEILMIETDPAETFTKTRKSSIQVGLSLFRTLSRNLFLRISLRNCC